MLMNSEVISQNMNFGSVPVVVVLWRLPLWTFARRTFATQDVCPSGVCPSKRFYFESYIPSRRMSGMNTTTLILVITMQDGWSKNDRRPIFGCYFVTVKSSRRRLDDNPKCCLYIAIMQLIGKTKQTSTGSPWSAWQLVRSHLEYANCIWSTHTVMLERS